MQRCRPISISSTDGHSALQAAHQRNMHQLTPSTSTTTQILRPVQWVKVGLTIICSHTSALTVTAALREMRTANKEVYEPKSKLQLISAGPVSQGDADKIYSLCKELGLVEKNIYKSEWVE